MSHYYYDDASYRAFFKRDLASPDSVELVLTFHSPSATGKLITVRDSNDKIAWLPCQLIRHRQAEGGGFRVTVPAWWAQRHGFPQAAPHPDPLPAGGEREKKKTAGG